MSAVETEVVQRYTLDGTERSVTRLPPLGLNVTMRPGIIQQDANFRSITSNDGSSLAAAALVVAGGRSNPQRIR